MAGPAPQSSILMHPYLLYLTPAHWGELYFGQFEALDLINCLISPLFFSSMLSRWPTPQDLLSLVYGTVLALKGYQLMLLLMPAARKRHAHKKARYWIILAERILRQWVASPLLGRGPRFVHYLHSTAAANPGARTAVKLALIVSGITHSTWNVFCLPLDFVSQVVITLVFFVINTSSALCQMAYPVAMLVQRWPGLLWGQWALEAIATAAVSPLRHLLGGAGVDPATGTQTADWCGAADGQGGVCELQDGQAQLTAVQLVLLPPGLAPDVGTLAGRWVLAVSMAVLLLTVLYLPLLFAWRLELHYKARFLVHAVRRSRGGIRAQLPGGPVIWESRKQQEAAASGACCATPSPPASPGCLAREGSREAGAGGWAGGKQCKAAPASHSCSSGKGEGADAECNIDGQQAQGACSCACCTAGSSAGSKGGRLVQPGSYPVLPPLSWASAKHLCAAVLACLLLGEGFVALCIVSPAVKGMLWPQIPMAAAP